MRQFNTPPEWPDPPTAGWRPPPRWRPPASWPTPPKGWAFWVDEHGRAVRGPVGRYGGASRIKVVAIVLVPTALMSLVLVNPWRADDANTTSPFASATETPLGRVEKPTREAARTAASTPPGGATIAPTSSVAPTSTILPTTQSTVVVYRDCAEVRAAGKAPLPRGNPGYSKALDRNRDNIACGPGDS